MYKICLFSLIVTAAAQHGYHDVDYYAEPHYSFEYDVKDLHTGDIKSHKEQRKGDHTSGLYMLVEPDGSKRIVEYEVLGKNGFLPKTHRGTLKLKDKYGHEGVVDANYNLYQSKVGEVVYHHASPAITLGPSPSYGASPSGYGASSSVKLSTNGAKVYTSTNHIVPLKHGY